MDNRKTPTGRHAAGAGRRINLRTIRTMTEQGRAAEGPQVDVAGKAQGWDYSPDAGETARAMTANAVVSAVANVGSPRFQCNK
jgi:hypothetical protein